MPHTSRALLAGLVLCAATGCGGGASPDLNREVRSAYLADRELTNLGLLMGVTSGSARLDVSHTDGSSGTYQVELTGPTVGLLVGVSGQVLSESETTTYDLSRADPPIYVTDLIGRFEGANLAFVPMLGVEVLSLSNDKGVGLDISMLAGGIEIALAYEWLDIAIVEE